MSIRAVVFGYHDVGDRCLRVLLSHGIEVPLVVTHRPDATETPWYASVAETAAEYGVPVLAPERTGLAMLESALAQLSPDFIFSFYYRHLLSDTLLRRAKLAALNLHGSLLPRYRGRAPVNWAILNGEHETGATLHHMAVRADGGDIVDQAAVPILQDDDARQVMAKVTVAAEMILARSLPALIAGNARRVPQEPTQGQYFGRRTPEDGRIDWKWPAARIHNLVRAVAPPYPAAFTDISSQRWWIHKTRITPKRLTPGPPRIYGEQHRCFIACSDGAVLELLGGATEDGPLDLNALAAELSARPLSLR